ANPLLTPADIRNLMQDATIAPTVSSTINQDGAGFIQADAAVQYAETGIIPLPINRQAYGQPLVTQGTHINDAFTGAYTAAQFGGTHTIDGGAGFGTLDYTGVTNPSNLPAGLIGNVPLGQVQFPWGSQTFIDSFANIEAFKGGSGNDTFVGGAENDTFYGGGGDDTFTVGSGTDTLSGGAGNDQFNLFGNLTAADQIDGGAGNDTLSLNGDYSARVTFTATTMVNVETIQLGAGHSYDLILNDATAGIAGLTVDGSALGGGD